MVAGFDVHLRQITFDAVDSLTGEVTRGRIASTPAAVLEWVAGFCGREVHVAIEACSGWLFVARALERAGAVAHLAETVETRALRGRKRRAKTDRQDALWLRELLAEGRLPEAWIPPEHIRQWRSRLHLRKALIDERTQWLLRIRSTLYHHGLSAGAPGEIAGPTGREFLAGLDLPADALERIDVATSPSTNPTITPGHLSRQGSPTLRWALYEAAQSATRPASPDYNDYHALKARGLTHTRASLTIARKIARRSYHLLHRLGPDRPRTDRRLTRVLPRSNRPPSNDGLQASSQLQQLLWHPPPGGDPDKDRAAGVDPRDDQSTITPPTASPGGRGPR